VIETLGANVQTLDETLDVDLVLHLADPLDEGLDVVVREGPCDDALMDAEVRRAESSRDAFAEQFGFGVDGNVGVLLDEGELRRIDGVALLYATDDGIELLGIAQREGCENIVLRFHER